MYNAKVLLSMAALVGSSLAQTPTGVDPTCLESLRSFSDAPTVGPSLVSYLGSIVTGRPTLPGHTTPLPDVTLEDPAGYQEFLCGLAAELPESLLHEFQSYASGLISYAAATLTSQLHDLLLGTGGACQAKPTTAPDASSNGTYPTATGATPTPTGSTSLIPVAAAARPTGAFIGAAAVGGLLGAVAML